MEAFHQTRTVSRSDRCNVTLGVSRTDPNSDDRRGEPRTDSKASIALSKHGSNTRQALALSTNQNHGPQRLRALQPLLPLEILQHLHQQHHVRFTHRLLSREAAAPESQTAGEPKLLGRCDTTYVLRSHDVHGAVAPTMTPGKTVADCVIDRRKMGSQARREERTNAPI